MISGVVSVQSVADFFWRGLGIRLVEFKYQGMLLYKVYMEVTPKNGKREKVVQPKPYWPYCFLRPW